MQYTQSILQSFTHLHMYQNLTMVFVDRWSLYKVTELANGPGYSGCVDSGCWIRVSVFKGKFTVHAYLS